MRKKEGFTLIELLVVVSIIALLVSILLPALSKARDMARRVVCGANMHQIGIAMHAYASENNDKLPEVDPSGDIGQWLFDVPYIAAEFIRKEYACLEVMYCPSNSLKKKHNDELLEYYTSHFVYSNPALRPDPDAAIPGLGRAITDYFWMMSLVKGCWRETAIYPLGSTFSGKKMFAKKISDGRSDLPMVTDLVWNQGTSDDFSTIISGSTTIGTLSTNHLIGHEAAGGNTMYFDGSTSWVQFEDMCANYTASYGSTHHYW